MREQVEKKKLPDGFHRLRKAQSNTLLGGKEDCGKLKESGEGLEELIGRSVLSWNTVYVRLPYSQQNSADT